MASSATEPVIVIGAGLAGLACADRLHAAGVPVRVLESSDEVGGRIRTDEVVTEEGTYRIDRGFQVYLTAYPEGRRVLRLADLGLRTFEPGALVRCDGRFWRAGDPLRSPRAALAMTRSPLIERRDLIALGMLDTKLRAASEAAAWHAPEETSETLLRGAGLSERVIDRFFRPFFGGVFLDRSLQTSARKLRFTYRMFARGRAGLPSGGMRAIPDQIAAGLDPGAIETGRTIAHVSSKAVTTVDGDVVPASAVVVATDGSSASRLVTDLPEPAWQSTTTVSFAAAVAPSPEPMLFLDGDGTGPANHVAVVSNVQPAYAPPGHALISATIVAPFDDSAPGLVDRVRAQMRDWFGPDAEAWRHLRTDVIPKALPDERAPALHEPRRSVETGTPGVLVAGDHRDNASINGALESGRRAADRVLAMR